MKRFAGKVAIVTGAGCVGPGWGNGRATAVRFAEESAQVLAVDRDLDRLNETIERAGGLAASISSGAVPSASSPQELAALLKRDTEKWGKLIKAKRITPEG